jgi:hypothetical protein
MRRLSLIIALAVGLTIAGAVVASNDDEAATLTRISNYRQWTRMNPDPVEVSVPVTTTEGIVSINPAALT